MIDAQEPPNLPVLGRDVMWDRAGRHLCCNFSTLGRAIFPETEAQRKVGGESKQTASFSSLEKREEGRAGLGTLGLRLVVPSGSEEVALHSLSGFLGEANRP